jgi:Cytochrome C'
MIGAAGGHWRTGLAVVIAAGLCGCHPRTQIKPAKPPAPATVQALMDGVIDPNADQLWASVGTIQTPSGEVHRQPATPEEWATVAATADRLTEGAARLAETRQVGGDGHGRLADASTAGIRTAAEITQAIAADPPRFAAAAERLRVAAASAQAAADHRDPAALLAAGAAMDATCEACHAAYWYPPGPPPALPSPAAFARIGQSNLEPRRAP